MTDLEKELARQIHELSKELMALRERVAILESKIPVPNFVEGRKDQPVKEAVMKHFGVEE